MILENKGINNKIIKEVTGKDKVRKLKRKRKTQTTLEQHGGRYTKQTGTTTQIQI